MFYKPELESINSRSFEKQRKWFINNPEKDPEYSEYLCTRTDWFEDLRMRRVKLTHYHPLITFQSTEHILTFGTHSDKKGSISNYPVLEYVNEKSSGLLEFIRFYDRHFGK